MPHQSAPDPIAVEVASGYLADVLAQTDPDAPFFKSRDLEEATRQLARAAYRADLSEVALTRWLVAASATAFGGGGGVSVRLTRQLHRWAADEFAAVAVASRRSRIARLA